MFLRPVCQLAFTGLIAFVQVFVIAIWFTVRGPDASVSYPSSNIAFIACKNLVDIHILVGLVYPFLLIIVCTILTTINRRVPTGFNETQYIGKASSGIDFLGTRFLDF